MSYCIVSPPFSVAASLGQTRGGWLGRSQRLTLWMGCELFPAWHSPALVSLHVYGMPVMTLKLWGLCKAKNKEMHPMSGTWGMGIKQSYFPSKQASSQMLAHCFSWQGLDYAICLHISRSHLTVIPRGWSIHQGEGLSNTYNTMGSSVFRVLCLALGRSAVQWLELEAAEVGVPGFIPSFSWEKQGTG